MEKLKDLIDKAMEGLAEILLPQPEPVPIRIKPARPQRPVRRDFFRRGIY